MANSSGSAAPRAILALLVGALVGFAAGYFAGGGGRPTRAVRAATESADVPPDGGRLEQLTSAVERDPENPELLVRLGNHYYDREEWEGAIAAYEKARRKAGSDPNLLSDLGAAHRNAGDFDLAVAYFQKAREANPDQWQALLNWVLVEAFDRRDPAEAQRLFDELQKRHPEIPMLDRVQAQISSLRAGA